MKLNSVLPDVASYNTSFGSCSTIGSISVVTLRIRYWQIHSSHGISDNLPNCFKKSISELRSTAKEKYHDKCQAFQFTWYKGAKNGNVMCWITAISLKDSTRQMIWHFGENKRSVQSYIFISLLSLKVSTVWKVKNFSANQSLYHVQSFQNVLNVSKLISCQMWQKNDKISTLWYQGLKGIWSSRRRSTY